MEYNTGLSEHFYRYKKISELAFSTFDRYFFFNRNLERSTFPVPEEVLLAYKQYEPIISSLYGEKDLNENLLFHGTGRFHYKNYGSDKYQAVDKQETHDVLTTVLKSGINPYKDIWVPTPADKPSISLTRQRFYARWYADKHNSEELLWSYGNSLDWASMFVVKNISGILDIPYTALLVRSQMRKISTGGLLGSVHSWASDARNDITPRTSYAEALATRSTISDNFGTLFGIEESEVMTYDFPLLKKTETRALEPIDPDSIQLIEVTRSPYS